MAITHHGIAGHQNGASGGTLTFSQQVPAGREIHLILCEWYTSGFNHFPLSLTDSRGNTYARGVGAAVTAAGGAFCWSVQCYKSRLTTQVEIGDTVKVFEDLSGNPTVVYGSATAHHLQGSDLTQTQLVTGGATDTTVPLNSLGLTQSVTSIGNCPAGAFAMGAFAMGVVSPETTFSMVYTGGLTEEGEEDVDPVNTQAIADLLYLMNPTAQAFTVGATASGVAGINAWMGYIAYVLPSVPPKSRVSFDRGMMGQMNAGVIINAPNTFSGTRYDDAYPQGVASSITIGSGKDGCVRFRGGSEVLDALYADNSGNIIHKTSRDHGRSWSMPTTLLTGYQGVTFDWSPEIGGMVIAVYDEDDEEWRVTVAQLDAAGAIITPLPTPQVAIDSAGNGAELRVNRFGRVDIMAIQGSDVVLTTCEDLSNQGVGTWS